jgi:non-specific serine/threonine protein kinase
MLCRASVFAGGWTLEAAERVCTGDGVEAWEVLDLLTSLTDRNLLATHDGAEATRYHMLETVREYASEQLHADGAGAGPRDRHLAYFREFATVAEPEFGKADQKAWLDRAEAEHDNIRAALAWAASTDGDATAGLALASALGRWWTIRGHMGEGRAWFARLLGMAPPETNATIRTQALSTAGNLAAHQGDLSAAYALHSECVRIRRTMGRNKALSTSLNNLGSVELDRGNYAAARAHLEESLTIVRELNDARGIAASLTNLGNLAADQGNRRAARVMYEEALSIRRVSGDQTGIHAVLHNLGSIAYDDSDYASARKLLEESLAIKRALGDRRGVAATLINLGNAIRELGDRGGACDCYNEAMPIFVEFGDGRGVSACLEGIAEVALADGRLDVAACLWGGAERLREEIGAPMPPAERLHHGDRVAAARRTLGDATFVTSWQTGRAMDRDSIVRFALDHAIGVDQSS